MSALVAVQLALVAVGTGGACALVALGQHLVAPLSQDWRDRW